MLEKGEQTAEPRNFKSKIEKAIWPENEMTGEIEKGKTLIESRVVDSSFGDVLTSILTTGQTSPDATDHYSVNYRRFSELFSRTASENALSIYRFLLDITKHVIVFPIKADTQETALRIFSTLNDRGLPLSDADIFKAKMYGFISDEEKKADFISRWKALDERAVEADESIQKLFYYMFFLRAQDNDTNTTTPGVRRYYAENKFSRLKRPGVIDDLDALMDVWEVVNARSSSEQKPWTSNAEICKMHDLLSMYPNEFWKYPVVVYYLAHRNNEEFEPDLLAFLKKLAAELISKFLKSPTVSAVKPGVLKLNAAVLASAHPVFDFGQTDWNGIREQVKVPNKRSFRMLLAVYAYEEQDEVLPGKWEIEHIFPKKWQENHFPTYDAAIVNEKIEHIGNKVPFEKKLNIVASNGYFAKKQKEYAKSSIAVTKALSEKQPDSWELSDIDERDVRVTDTIIETLKKWCEEYECDVSVDKGGVSAEDAELIKMLKNKYGKDLHGLMS